MLFKPAYIAGLSGFEKFPAKFPAAGNLFASTKNLAEGPAYISDPSEGEFACRIATH